MIVNVVCITFIYAVHIKITAQTINTQKKIPIQWIHAIKKQMQKTQWKNKYNKNNKKTKHKKKQIQKKQIQWIQ